MYILLRKCKERRNVRIFHFCMLNVNLQFVQIIIMYSYDLNLNKLLISSVFKSSLIFSYPYLRIPISDS